VLIQLFHLETIETLHISHASISRNPAVQSSKNSGFSNKIEGYHPGDGKFAENMK